MGSRPVKASRPMVLISGMSGGSALLRSRPSPRRTGGVGAVSDQPTGCVELTRRRGAREIVQDAGDVDAVDRQLSGSVVQLPRWHVRGVKELT